MSSKLVPILFLFLSFLLSFSSLSIFDKFRPSCTVPFFVEDFQNFFIRFFFPPGRTRARWGGGGGGGGGGGENISSGAFFPFFFPLPFRIFGEITNFSQIFGGPTRGPGPAIFLQNSSSFSFFSPFFFLFSPVFCWLWKRRILQKGNRGGQGPGRMDGLKSFEFPRGGGKK